MDKTSLIPDNEFFLLSKNIKELKTHYYKNKNLKVDFPTLIFSRIDELLEAYANALNENADKEIFDKIKFSLQENCYLLKVALEINLLEDVKQIEHKPKFNFNFLVNDPFPFPIDFSNFRQKT